MPNRSSYEILGIARDVSDEEIKSTYRKLAVRFHPDKNPGDASAADRFREITAAYETVKDTERRAAYDTACASPASAPAAAGSRAAGSGTGAFDLSEALKCFMSNLRADTSLRDSFEGGNQDPARGENKRVSIPLTLHDVSVGSQKTIKVRHLKTCTACTGQGAAGARAAFSPCRQCGGHGIVRIAGRTDTVACPRCQGSTREILNACPSCAGYGRVPGESTVSVKFSAGIGEGNFLCLPGMGDAGFRGGPAGDLMAYVEEVADTQFRRRGCDLETDATIPMLTAVLGGRCMVLTLAGETMSIRIPAGTQPESLFNLKGHGLPLYMSASQGNLFVRVHVRIPEQLSAEEKTLYETLARSNGDRDRVGSRSTDVDDGNWLIRESGSAWLINGGRDDFDDAVFDTPEVVKLLAGNGMKIGIDLRRVRIVQSMTIGRWMRVWKDVQRTNSTLFLLGPNSTVRGVLSDMNINAVFPVFDKESEIV